MKHLAEELERRVIVIPDPPQGERARALPYFSYVRLLYMHWHPGDDPCRLELTKWAISGEALDDMKFVPGECSKCCEHGYVVCTENFPPGLARSIANGFIE